LAITVSIGIAGWAVSGCDSSPPADPGRTICAQVGDAGAGCALPAGGSGADAAPARAPTPAPGTDAGLGGGPGVVTTEVTMLPCTVCAHADACCRAGGFDDCTYAAACTGAHSTDEQQLRVAMCQAVVSGTPVPGRATCGGPR